MLSKAKGLTVRIALVLHVLNHAIQALSEPDQPQPQGILQQLGVHSINQATNLMDHFLEIKAILRPTNPATTEKVQEQSSNEATKNDKIRKILLIQDNSITPSLVSRKSWCFPVNGKYTVQSAITILQEMESIGLGAIREIAHPHNNKKSKVFVKKTYADLSTDAVAYITSINVLEQQFQ